MNKQLLITLFSALFFTAASAQTGYYLVPGYDQGNPGSVNKDVEYPSGGGLPSGWSVVMNGDTSTKWTNNLTVPFPFKFNNDTVKQYKVSSSGVLTFDLGAGTAPVKANTDLPSSKIPDKSIMCWGLHVSTGDFIVTKTFGTAPKRQHWIQFNSAHEENLTDGWIYMSIVLEEGSNNVYFVDQRTQCIKNSANCSNMTTLSLGTQINGTTATKVPGTPNFASFNKNDFEIADNRYFTLRPGDQPSNDVAVQSVDMTDFIVTPDAPFTVKFWVKNNGSTNVNSMNVTYFIPGGDTVTDDITGLNIGVGNAASISHPIKWNPAKGKYNLNIVVNQVNGDTDSYVADNKTSKTLTVVDKIVPRKVLHEVFTSSSCGPCAPGNANFENIVKSKSKHTTIKYQMNYPGNGDPYYTSESGTRHSFYGINSIPRMEVDGGWNSNANNYTSGLYDNFAAKPAFIEIVGSASYSWKNTITANVTLKPTADISSSNLKLFGVVVEKATYNNVATNGETEFFNVSKKVMPSTSGLALTGGMQENTDVSKTLSFEFKGNYRLPANALSPINLSTENSIESWDNLAVVVFVQDATTKEVFQSEMFDVATTGIADLENGISIFPVPAQNMVYVEAKEAFNGATANVMVTNSLGQTMHQGIMENGKYQFDATDFANGVYFVNIQSGNTRLARKVIIQH